MKWIILAASLLLNTSDGQSFIILDKTYQSPAFKSEMFSTAMYLKGLFPLQEKDAKSILSAVVKTAKAIDRGLDCNIRQVDRFDNTLMVLSTACSVDQAITLTITTQVGELSYQHYILKNADNSRNTQRKLLDFVTYVEAIQ